MEKEGRGWIVKVINLFPNGSKVISNFHFKFHTLENILSKIEADLMNNLHNGIETPIVIQIKGERLKNKVGVNLK